MSSIKDYIRNIRTKYENWAVREDMAKALEYLVANITGLKHNAGGSNLIEYPAESFTQNGITFEPTDAGIHVYGTATSAAALPLDWGQKDMVTGKPYVASLGKSGSGAVYFEAAYYMDDKKTVTRTIGRTESVMNFVCPAAYKTSKNSITVPVGSTVDCIVNPRLRLANEEDPTQPETYTVEEISQKIHSGAFGGGAGFKIVSQYSLMTDPDLVYVYEGTETDYSQYKGYWFYHNGTRFVPAAQFYLGKDGVDGVSPTANVTRISGGARITVTDANGTTSVTVNDATNVDQEARDSVTQETNRATAAEAELGIRIDEIGQRSFDWEEIISTNQYGPTFRVLVCRGLGLFIFSHYGVWTSVPQTNGKWITLGQNDVFKYDSSMISDFGKHHYQISKDIKAEVWITANGEVKWGMTATISGNNNTSATKGGGCRTMLVLPLPSVMAPIQEVTNG